MKYEVRERILFMKGYYNVYNDEDEYGFLKVLFYVDKVGHISNMIDVYSELFIIEDVQNEENEKIFTIN